MGVGWGAGSSQEKKDESAEDTPHLSHRPGTTRASLQTRGSFMRSRGPAVPGGASGQSQAGREQEAGLLACLCVCVPPRLPPNKSYGLKGLDPHFPNMVWAASRVCGGCQGVLQAPPPGASRGLKDSWGTKCKPYSNCKASKSILLRRM